MISVCGINCTQCPHFENGACKGCTALEGKVFWTVHIGASECPIHACVRHEKQLAHCGHCREVPCGIWQSLKDPSYSDEAHAQGIRDRIAQLQALKPQEPSRAL